MKFKNIVEGCAIVGVASLVVMAAAGWIFNIVEIFSSVNMPVSGMFILRCIGIFVAPLGAILGWI